MAGRRADDWIGILGPIGIPIGRINSLAEVFDPPQVKHNKMVVEMDHPVAGPIKLLNNPLRFSETAVELRSPPPLLGQNTEEVLAELGYPAEAVAHLRQRGVI